MGEKISLSINDSNIINILSRSSSDFGVSYSLTDIINRYYKIYLDYKEKTKKFKTMLMEKFNSNYNLLFVNMQIDNVKVGEDRSISFNLSQEYPVKYFYELQYSYDSRIQNFMIKYDTTNLSEIEKSFLSRFNYILGYEKNIVAFRDLISTAILFYEEYSFDCSVKGSLPFKIILKDSKVCIEYTNLNNISEVLTIDFDKKDISYTNLVEEEDFLSLFKYSLKEILDGIFIDVPNAFRSYNAKSDEQFCQTYLFNRDESELKEENEEIPYREYYLIQGSNEYKKITGYKNVNKYNGRLKFEFDDGSELAIPENFIIVINNNNTEDYIAHNFFEEKILGLKRDE